MVYTRSKGKLPKACINLHTPPQCRCPEFPPFPPKLRLRKMRAKKWEIYQVENTFADFSFPILVFFVKKYLHDELQFGMVFCKVRKFSILTAAGPPIFLFFFARETEGSWASFPTCPSSKYGASYYFTTSSSGREGEKEEERKTPLCFCSPPFLWQATGARSAPFSLLFWPYYSNLEVHARKKGIK